ncbi:Death-inducer obliterator 1 [Geodia barretti]|uniref:Death-inducer obliterator 1 n=1 Tax=Geodia barretti TaxID=519541 RepID=A0AA35SH71_GEOBA|nr:Death-inducer obliterator 1 [Geodia barretti]
MDGNLLDAGNGDAIARDWELPELPSGSASLISTPSFPTSQELAEIFGNSDDEDDDFPFPPLSGGLAAVGGASSAMAPSLGGPQQGQGSESLLSSLMGPETKQPPLHDGVSEHLPVPSAIQTPPSEENRTSTTSSDTSAHQRKSPRISSRLSDVKTDDKIRKAKPPPAEMKISETPTSPEKGAPLKSPASAAANANSKATKQEKEAPAIEEGEKKEEEGEEEERGQESDDEEDEDEEGGSISDDPDRLWCVCRKPHNDRFMICCDVCEEWFHGDCVGISVSQGRRMERAGKEYICPVCTERTKLEKEIKSASRMARQEKREEMRETRQKSATEKHGKDSHRRRSLSGSQSSSGVAKEGGDNYGIDLLFQPDNAPPRTPPTSGTQDGERRGRVKRRKRSFYRIKEESDAVMCIVPQCSAHTTSPSLYCSDACIETYAADSLRDLASRGITFETDPSEFVRGSKGISMVDKATGKTVIGIQAPTDKTLVSWLKQHPSYQVLLPSGKHGRDLGSRVRPKRLKQESEKGGGQEGMRSEDSPSKPRSLNDPETVRMNAKKALHQTLWKRKEAVDDVAVAQERVEKIANQIEVKLFNLHGDINTKYKTKYRSLLFNLKDTKNQGLFRKVCLGQISPSELVKMKSEQYASDELAEWREKTLKKDLDKIVEREEEEGSNKKVIRKITYKGEEEIEAEKIEAIEYFVCTLLYRHLHSLLYYSTLLYSN